MAQLLSTESQSQTPASLESAETVGSSSGQDKNWNSGSKTRAARDPYELPDSVFSQKAKARMTTMTEDLKMDEQDVATLARQYCWFMEQQRMRNSTNLCHLSEKAPYFGLKSFALVPDDVPRLLVIGDTRIGKSSFCNKLAGLYYQLIERSHANESDVSDSDSDSDPTEFTAELRDGETELFTSGPSLESVTQKANWAQVNFLGDSCKPLVIIDTPGLRDFKQNDREAQRIDLKQKLTALQRIDLILVLLGKASIGGGAGKNEGTLQTVSDVLSLFGGNKGIFKENVVFGFTLCDERDTQWRTNYKTQKKEWKTFFQQEFYGDFEDKVKITFYQFSSVQDNSFWNQNGTKRWSQYKQFEKLFNKLQEAHTKSLRTTNYLEMLRMQSAIRHIHQNGKMSEDEAFEYLMKEMIGMKRDLRRNYEENTKFLRRIPKNTIDGLVKAGKTVVSCVAMGGSCLVKFPKKVSEKLWGTSDAEPGAVGSKGSKGSKRSKQKIKVAGKAAVSVVALPVSVAVATVAAVGVTAGGVLGALTTAAVGVVNHSKTKDYENEVEAEIAECKEDFDRKRSIVVENSLNRESIDVKEVSILKKIFSKHIDWTEAKFIEFMQMFAREDEEDGEDGEDREDRDVSSVKDLQEQTALLKSDSVQSKKQQ